MEQKECEAGTIPTIGNAGNIGNGNETKTEIEDRSKDRSKDRKIRGFGLRNEEAEAIWELIEYDENCQRIIIQGEKEKRWIIEEEKKEGCIVQDCGFLAAVSVVSENMLKIKIYMYIEQIGFGYKEISISHDRYTDGNILLLSDRNYINSINEAGQTLRPIFIEILKIKDKYFEEFINELFVLKERINGLEAKIFWMKI
ncbi:hypothetical protein [uncultured archaeal virus]|uniref:Uncharacterized protein n=1 Tax=uncultured archaeal virus TaxID=1960247 RepID=A0A8B0LSG3_9VIRU|nr:hypothetical protein [uncultured archaeal virus]